MFSVSLVALLQQHRCKEWSSLHIFQAALSAIVEQGSPAPSLILHVLTLMEETFLLEVNLLCITLNAPNLTPNLVGS